MPYRLLAGWLSILFVLAASGCGYRRIPLSSTPDFSIAVSPAAATVVAGTIAPLETFTIKRVNGFTGAVTVVGSVPNGLGCMQANCTVVIPADAASSALQYAVTSGTPAGTVTLNFTATSGTLTHTATATVTITPTMPDFSIAVSPSTATVAAGSAAPAESFTLNRYNGFTGAVTVTGSAPDSITCAPSDCSVVITGDSASNALQFTVPASTPVGTVTLTFTATSGSLTHTITASLAITAGVTPVVVPPPAVADACAVPATTTQPAYSATGFIATGTPGNPNVTYDKLHNQIFSTNLQLNEIDIISPEQMATVARLPIPQPMGIDISADGSTMIVGTRTHYFYQVSTSSLCITDREYLPVNSYQITDLSPMYPTALADGSILFAAFDIESSASSVFRWIPGTGFVQPSGLADLAYAVQQILPSGDRQHAYLAGREENGSYGRFDLTTGSVVTAQLSDASYPHLLAVNADGSRAFLNTSSCALAVADSNFNQIACYSATVSPFSGVAAAPDFSAFYIPVFLQDYTTILNASLQPTGIIPFSLTPQLGDYSLQGFDGTRRLIATSPLGVFLINTSTVAALPADSSQLPAVSDSDDIQGAMVPDTPQNGFSTMLTGSGFLSAPTVNFLEAASSVPVPGATTTSPSRISLTAPSLSDGCFDVSATFPNGDLALAPLAYCYSPMVDSIDGDAGPTTGGGTLTLYGRGFGQNPSVAVGGTEASNVRLTYAYEPHTVYTTTKLTATVPSGSLGPADIVVSSATGSLLLKGAYTYAQRQDTPLPANAQPQQLILDSPRRRILLLDAHNNQLLVYHVDSGSLMESIPTGPDPQGLALTPDGDHVVIITASDGKVSLLDAASYQTLQQETMPTSWAAGPLGPPVQVVTLAGDIAIVKTEAGFLQSGDSAFSYPLLFDYNLNTNAITADPFNSSGHFPDQYVDYSIAASADGEYGLFGGIVLNVATGAFTGKEDSSPPGGDVALASDGMVGAEDIAIVDSANRWQTTVTAATPIANFPNGEYFFSGMQMNATGSLLYMTAADHVRIYDTAHGILARTVEIPGGAIGSDTQRLLAVDPGGQRFILVTSAGVSIFTFASDPLTANRAVVSGSQLTVSGSGFQSGATLQVDLTAATCTVTSSTSLTCTLPALASGPHSVTVTNPDGHTYTLSLAFSTS